jgi:UDP-glucuronate decarboxylase
MHPADGRVVSNFIVQAIKGEAITIYGDGRQTRSFCYVDDLVDGLIRLMESEASLVGPVNLGNPEEFTIGELAEKVVGLAGRATIHHLPLPADDPRQRCPDISLAKEKLGWEPRIRLDQGLMATFAYFRELLAGENASAGPQQLRPARLKLAQL